MRQWISVLLFILHHFSNLSKKLDSPSFPTPVGLGKWADTDRTFSNVLNGIDMATHPCDVSNVPSSGQGIVSQLTCLYAIPVCALN